MQPVMLATDGSPTAATAAETAIELAQVFDTDLVVVTVWDLPYTSIGFAPVPVTGELATLGEEQATRICLDAAARAQEAGVETKPVVPRGMPVQEICLAVEEFEPRFLVVGSHGWGFFKRALFGSVSAGVLHYAACPVLVVRGVPAADERSEADVREHVPA